MIRAKSDIEAIKLKKSEELFMELLDNRQGFGISKIAPFNAQYFDLLYVERESAALFKFLDTNEETFSILAEEIVEVIEEEYETAQNLVREKLDGLNINYYFVMPFVSLEKYEQKSNVIIDREGFDKIADGTVDLLSLLSDIQGMYPRVLYRLAKEYFVFQKEPCLGDFSVDIDYGRSKIKAVRMEEAQMERVNDFQYGSTLLEGPTGTGKTSILFAKLIKIARIYPREKFLYITFDKQLSNEISNLLRFYHSDIGNVRVINFHQFILQLGKKYNLKLNKKSKQSFNKEFDKVFAKISEIYKGKRYYKGIFVDEAENFSCEEMRFLRNISHKTKNFLYFSFDEAKQMTPIRFRDDNVSHFEIDHKIRLYDNYRASREIGRFNLDFQNDLNAFSALEINRIDDYFLPFATRKPKTGNATVLEYESTEEMLQMILEQIRRLIEKGHKESDICIIYPFNEKGIGAKYINSKKLLQEALVSNGSRVHFADDEVSNLSSLDGICLSNIYNCTNLEWKLVIVCQLDLLYREQSEMTEKETQKMLNIIYTASGRASEGLFFLIKKDEERPGIIDLLGQR